MQTMKNTVAIVDYGMGNLRSVWQAVQAAAADSSVQVQVTHAPAAVSYPPLTPPPNREG